MARRKRLTRKKAIKLLRAGKSGKWNDLRAMGMEIPDLTNANLLDADLRWMDLRGAKLRDANLSGARLSGADLQKADLRGACFNAIYGLWNCDLDGAKITFRDETRIIRFEKPKEK